MNLMRLDFDEYYSRFYDLVSSNVLEFSLPQFKQIAKNRGKILIRIIQGLFALSSVSLVFPSGPFFSLFSIFTLLDPNHRIEKRK